MWGIDFGFDSPPACLPPKLLGTAECGCRPTPSPDLTCLWARAEQPAYFRARSVYYTSIWQTCWGNAWVKSCTISAERNCDHNLFFLSSLVYNKCWRGCGEKGTLLYWWWEGKLVQPLWRRVWRFLKKLKIELPYDPATPLLGIHPEKTIILKDTCIPEFLAPLFTMAKTWKQP